MAGDRLAGMRSASDPLAVGVVFIAITVLACFAPVQSDTWWHLRAGQDFWEAGEPPLVDRYSYTAAGRAWPNHEWLTQALFYGLFRAGGLPLLQAFAAAAVTLALALVWRMRRGSFEADFVVFCLALVPSVVVWAVRPQVLSLALFAITCDLIRRNRWGWLPVVIAVWTNLHGAVALGIVAIGSAALATSWQTRRVAWWECGIAAACFAATGLSPLGFSLWAEIAASVVRSRTNLLVEWQPPGLSVEMLPFWAAAALLVGFGLRRARVVDPGAGRLLAISVATLPLALVAIRNVPVFLLAAVPTLSALIAAHQPAALPRIRRVPASNVWVLGAAALGAAGIIGLGWSAPSPASGWRPMTAEARTAIRGCGSPIYNTFVQGGPLIWFVPEVKVFVDNRQDPYPADLLLAARLAEQTGSIEALASQYGFRCALAPPGSRVAAALRRDSRWRLQFEDAQWVVFTAGNAAMARAARPERSGQ